MEGGGDCCSWFSCAGCTPSQPARGGKGHLHATADLGWNRPCWGGGRTPRPQDPGLRAGWGRTHLDPGISTSRKQSEGGGTGGPLLGAFSFSRVGASEGKGLEAVFTKNFKKMSKVHIKEGQWGLLSESGSLPEGQSPLNKCRPPLPHFLGVDRDWAEPLPALVPPGVNWLLS